MPSALARRRSQGQALVEFAVVVPLFLLLMLGLIDFSRLLFSYISLANGTREMARVVALSANTDANWPIDAFNNLTVLGGAMNAATDSVIVAVYDQTGVLQGSPGTCPLPLTYAGCSLPARTGFHDGWIDVSATYIFHFNALFENKLSGVVDVSLMRPTSTLTTSVRSYIE